MRPSTSFRNLIIENTDKLETKLKKTKTQYTQKYASMSIL